MTLPRALVLLLAVQSGCYASHRRAIDRDDAGRSVDAGIDAGRRDAGRRDAGAVCSFAFTSKTGERVECTIGSAEGCTEAARCVCEHRVEARELVRCVGWDLTPRGAITYADYCAVDGEPPRSTLGEAIRGVLGSADIAEACFAMPALIGSTPYEACALVHTRACGCDPEGCDPDALLGRPCLSLTTEQARCVNERLAGPEPCPVLDPAAAVRACTGE